MIVTVVQFKLPEPITLAQAKDIFSSTAPKYRTVGGLIRKNYILSEDGKMAGGVYVWKSRNDAENLYDDQWRAFVMEKYGSEPTVQYFESPVLVDNVAGEIITDG
ncbi:MAG: monooxygenase [Deltaproteobacteria bacterium]|nr:monooxygenase [Deltaproteobacteria bacterium]